MDSLFFAIPTPVHDTPISRVQQPGWHLREGIFDLPVTLAPWWGVAAADGERVDQRVPPASELGQRPGARTFLATAGQPEAPALIHAPNRAHVCDLTPPLSDSEARLAGVCGYHQAVTRRVPLCEAERQEGARRLQLRPHRRAECPASPVQAPSKLV